MISVIFTLQRRPDMSREEFSRYWKDTHEVTAYPHQVV